MAAPRCACTGKNHWNYTSSAVQKNANWPSTFQNIIVSRYLCPNHSNYIGNKWPHRGAYASERSIETVQAHLVKIVQIDPVLLRISFFEAKSFPQTWNQIAMPGRAMAAHESMQWHVWYAQTNYERTLLMIFHATGLTTGAHASLCSCGDGLVRLIADVIVTRWSGLHELLCISDFNSVTDNAKLPYCDSTAKNSLRDARAPSGPQRQNFWPPYMPSMPSLFLTFSLQAKAWVMLAHATCQGTPGRQERGRVLQTSELLSSGPSGHSARWR